MRCLSVFHQASQALVRHENAKADKSPDRDFDQLQLERTLPQDEWIRVVIGGADDQSPRWRHLLMLGGLLLGFGPAEDENLSRNMRSTLESALVTAANATLEEMTQNDELGQQTVTLVLNHCFPALSDSERARLDYERLLPVLMRTLLHSPQGLRSAYFLGAVDPDVRGISASQFQWSERSPSFQQVQSMLSGTLLSSLGPLARLIGHAIEQVKGPWLITAALEDIESVARTLYLQWRHTKLSEIDASEESIFLDTESLTKTTPVLWKLLRSSLYALVIILRSVVGRTLGDSALASDSVATEIATRTLHTLRYLFFITLRLGPAAFSQYTFIYLCSLDILSAYPEQTEDFLRAIKPSELGRIPPHPLDRCLDLFFLNTAEQFATVLGPQASEELLVACALPYLSAGSTNTGPLIPIFEAAHSVLLAVFSSPQNATLTGRHLPAYVETLFAVFPANLSARQFRIAFKTLLQLTSPPLGLAERQPELAGTLLELLYHRAEHAAVVPLPPQHNSHDAADPATEDDVIELSEQAIFTLTLMDTLPHISLALLDEWLPLVADAINNIDDSSMRDYCKDHMWHMLIDGEMDPDRSQLCAGWWSTGGGREMILFGREEREETGMKEGTEYEMSGALPNEAMESKL